MRCHRSDIGSRVCWLPQYALRGHWPIRIMPNVIECALPHAPTIYQIQLPSHAALALLTQTILRGGQPPPAQLNAWLGALPTPRGFDLGRFAQSSANPVSPGRAARALPSTAQSMRAGIEWAFCKKTGWQRILIGHRRGLEARGLVAPTQILPCSSVIYCLASLFCAQPRNPP